MYNICTKNNLIKYANLIALIVFSLFFFYQYLGPNKYPGDNGDGKHIILVLENFYLASTERNFSFTETNFFYPLKNSIFFSETLWGIAWIYAIFRYLNFEIFESFKLIFFLVFIFNFFSCYYCSRKINISSFSSIIISSLFTFSLPVIAQDSHFALIFRAFVPLSILSLYLYFKQKKNRYLILLSIFVLLQFLSGIYVAMFLLVVLGVSTIVFTKSNNYSLFKFYFLLKKTNHITFAIVIGSIFLMLFYLSFYLEISKIYSFKRGYAYENLINIYSFFTTDRSIFWPNNMLPKKYPLQEQQLYPGISFFIFLFLIVIKKDFLFKPKLDDGKLFLNISLLSILIFFSFYQISAYFLLQLFPGFSSMRMGTRSFLVILFPILIFIALNLDKIFKKNVRYKYFVQILFIFCLIEIATAKKTTTNIIDENLRIKKYDNLLKDFNKDTIVVFKNSKKNPDYIINEIDFMFVATKHKLKTMNGFSSYVPKEYIPFESCEKVFENLDFAKSKLLKQNVKLEISKIIEKINFVGFEEQCKKN
jgi:hypothetical protein